MKSQKFRKNRNTIKRATLIGQHTIKGGRKKQYLKNNNRQNQIRRNTRKMRGGTRRELIRAIRRRNIDTVTQILSTGVVDINQPEFDVTPLILAIRIGNIDIVRLLLQNGANPNYVVVMISGRRNTALNEAITVNNIEIATLLLENGADPTGPCVRDWAGELTPLNRAIELNNIEMLRLLLQNGADPTFIHESGSPFRNTTSVMMRNLILSHVRSHVRVSQINNRTDNYDAIISTLYGRINLRPTLSSLRPTIRAIHVHRDMDGRIVDHDNVFADRYEAGLAGRLITADPVRLANIAPYQAMIAGMSVRLAYIDRYNQFYNDVNAGISDILAMDVINEFDNDALAEMSDRLAMDVINEFDNDALAGRGQTQHNNGLGFRPRENRNIIDLEEIITEEILNDLRSDTMNKRIEFLKSKTRNGLDAIIINIARENVFNDSFNVLNDALKGNNKYARMSVKFINEPGIDAGGLTTEYFNLVSKYIVDPENRLFTTYNNGGSYQPHTLGNKLDNFEEKYKFIGRLVGKAICSGCTLDELVFNKPFLKHIIDEEIVLEDVQFADCELYNSLKNVSAKPVDVIWGFDFTNPVSSPRRGDPDYSPPLYQDLNNLKRKPSTGQGDHELVNDENKNDYINKKLKFKTTYRIKQQIDAFLEGLYSMIPKKFLKLFTIEELELLISGFQIIDVNKIKEKTTYEGVYVDNQARYESDDTIVWFWDILHEADQEFLKKLLHFFTSSSRIGINSKFKIVKGNEHPRLPGAHTCFNQLVLSNYDNKEQLKKMLTFAIHDSDNFGFA